MMIISYFRKMSGIINPMNHVYFQKWREYVEGRGGKIFCSVLEGGKVTTTGDRALFEKYSKNWIPPTPLPKLPAKLSELMDYNMCEISKMKILAKMEFQFFTPPPLRGGY